MKIQYLILLFLDATPCFSILEARTKTKQQQVTPAPFKKSFVMMRSVIRNHIGAIAGGQSQHDRYNFFLFFVIAVMENKSAYDFYQYKREQPEKGNNYIFFFVDQAILKHRHLSKV